MITAWAAVGWRAPLGEFLRVGGTVEEAAGGDPEFVSDGSGGRVGEEFESGRARDTP